MRTPFEKLNSWMKIKMNIPTECERVIRKEIEIDTDDKLHHIGVGWVVKHKYCMPEMPRSNSKAWHRWYHLSRLFDAFDKNIYAQGSGSTFCAKIGATLLDSDTVYPMIRDMIKLHSSTTSGPYLLFVESPNKEIRRFQTVSHADTDKFMMQLGYIISIFFVGFLLCDIISRCS